MRRCIAIVIWVGCYAPQPQPGAPCANGACPDGLICSPATSTCERTAVDVDATQPVDASNDAARDAPLDAAPMALVVQQATNYAASANTISVTMPSAPKNGNVLV